MLIKVSKDLSRVTVIEVGKRYEFALSVAYRLCPISKLPSGKEKSIADKIARFLSSRDPKVGEFSCVGNSSDKLDYVLIASELMDKPLIRVADYLSDFGDEEREKVFVEIFKIIRRGRQRK